MRITIDVGTDEYIISAEYKNKKISQRWEKTDSGAICKDEYWKNKDWYQALISEFHFDFDNACRLSEILEGLCLIDDEFLDEFGGEE